MNGLIEQLTELRLHGMADAAKDLLGAKGQTSGSDPIQTRPRCKTFP